MTSPGGNSPAVALTIAGSDPSGGAGVQADLRTWAVLGVHGTSVLTAVTVQDTTAVHEVAPVDPDLVRRQLETVTADMPPAATKTGLLASAETIDVVAACAAEGTLGSLVVDPVMRASTGSMFVTDEMMARYLVALVPRAAVLTPNVDEAARLTGRKVGSVADMEDAARALLATGVGAVVVTGGHLSQDDGRVVDVIATASGTERLPHDYVATRNTHGTGCTFSAALTAYLAQGSSPVRAAEAAGTFVALALSGAVGWTLGRGAGPLDQMSGSSGSGLPSAAPRPPR